MAATPKPSLTILQHSEKCLPSGLGTSWRGRGTEAAGSGCLQRYSRATLQRQSLHAKPSGKRRASHGGGATRVAARGGAGESPPSGAPSTSSPSSSPHGSGPKHRVAGFVTRGVTWVLVPLLVLSLLTETARAIVANATLLMALGLLIGAAAGGVLHEIWVELTQPQSAREAGAPWDLVVLVILFTALKAPALNRATWAGHVLPHIANGGLWQAVIQFYRWRQQRGQQGNGREQTEGRAPAMA